MTYYVLEFKNEDNLNTILNFQKSRASPLSPSFLRIQVLAVVPTAVPGQPSLSVSISGRRATSLVCEDSRMSILSAA